MTNDPLQALLQGGEIKVTQFSPSSRYYNVETMVFETSSGREIIHLRRRFVPPPERFSLLQDHTVVQGDRLDNLAGKYLNDPEQSWQLCDANGAVRPHELTETIGRKLRVTLPEGIPGAGDA